MADILSQDEIDRLLNAASMEPAAVSGGVTLDDETISRVMRVVAQIFSTANSTLGTLIARPATVTHGGGESMPPSDMDNRATVVVHAPFRSGFAGEICFVLDASAATQLADLILGGEGAAKDTPDEADFDALKEAFSQIVGNAAPSITGAVSVDVGFGSTDAHLHKAGEIAKAFSTSSVFAAKGQLKIDGVLTSVLWVACDTDTAEGIASALTPEEAAPAASMPEPMQMRAAPTQAAPSQGYAQLPPEVRNIDLILDIEVEVMVRLGNSEMPLREIQKLRPGSIIDLDRDTDALVELVVNEKVIAKGELVVVSSDHFALRVTEILTPTERIRSLGGF